MKILIINGPNLKMIDYRDEQIYGKKNFQWLDENLISKHKEYEMVFTNYEGKFIEFIHKAIISNYDGLIVNPGAYSHYSYAIRDALEMFKGIKIEVHLSSVKNREKFRQNLVCSDVVDQTISGKGMLGYLEAIDYIQKNI